MKFLFLLVSYLSSFAMLAQSMEDEVNRDVWTPFIEAYNALDAEAFLAVHADDVVRVNRDGQIIRTGEDYAHTIRQSFKQDRENGTRMMIDLRFLERFYTGEAGFEVGIYRVRRASGGQEQLFYGKFHVLLRKQAGTWKIAMDSDISNDGMIREEDFMKAEPLLNGE